MTPDEKFTSYVRESVGPDYLPEPEHDDVEGMTFGTRLVLVALGVFLFGAFCVALTGVLLLVGA